MSPASGTTRASAASAAPGAAVEPFTGPAQPPPRASGDAVALCVLLAVLCALPFVASGYVLYVVNLLMVFVVLALGMHVVVGEAGQFALSHTAFYGIGIYTAGLLNARFGLPLIVNLAAAGVLAGVFGYLLGYLSLRMRDIYLALATFAFGEAMQWVFLNWEPVTGGTNGLRMQPATLAGLRLSSDAQAYPFVVALAAVMLLVTVWLSRSQFGTALRAVRESEVAATAMGIDAQAMKRAAFAVSAAFAGVAGGMYTLFVSFIHPESLGVQTTILVLTMVVVGGIGSVRGAVAGALFFGIVSELLRQALSVQEILYGLILMGFMMFRPRGLFAHGGARRLRRPDAAGRAAPPRTGTGGVAVNGPAPAMPGDADDAFVDVRDLTIRFGGLTAVDGLSFRVRRGTVHALIGPNGAGKSTTFNCISRHYTPASGRIVLDGDDITQVPARSMARRGVARTFQNLELFAGLSTWENVLAGCHARSAATLPALLRRPDAATRDEIDALLERVGLAAHRDTRAGDLDFGSQKLLELARALALRPRLLLLDEPAAGLRNRDIDALDRLLADLARNEGITVLLVEHVMSLVMSISDRITVMSSGRLLAEGTPAQIARDERVIEAYLGRREESA